MRKSRSIPEPLNHVPDPQITGQAGTPVPTVTPVNHYDHAPGNHVVPPSLEGDWDTGGRLLLRVEEAARSLGISRSRVYELLAGGEIRSVKIGTSRRIPRLALHEYIARLEEEEAMSQARLLDSVTGSVQAGRYGC